jgi:hypothetical protein
MEPTYHISSVALSFDRALLQNIDAAKALNATSLIHHIDIFGNTGIVTISGAFFNCFEPLVYQICTVLTKLVQDTVFCNYIKITDFRIYALELKYMFVSCNPFIFNKNGFTQVGYNKWQSNDFRRIYRPDGEFKGMQRSFITLESTNGGYGVNLQFNLLGRKRQYLGLVIFRLTVPQLFIQLIPLLSCYLTQTITPQEFGIDSQYMPLLSPEFTAIFANANWFNGNNFISKRVRNNVRGSLTLEKMPVLHSAGGVDGEMRNLIH